MVLSRDAFIDALTALGELLPMGKTLSPSAVALAWGTFPLTAKELLDADGLLYAMQQLQLDPHPAKELSVAFQLLRYVFPCAAPTYASDGTCKNPGQPILDRGLRDDLPARMEHPEVFHALHHHAASKPASVVLEESRLLAPLGDGAMEQLALVTKPLVLAARTAKEAATASNPLTPREEELACLLAAGAVIGRWSLDTFDHATSGWPRDRPWRNLAREWVAAHPKGYAAMQIAMESALQSSRDCLGDEPLASAEKGAFLGSTGAPEGLLNVLAA